MTIRPIEPAHDADIEGRFGLLAGRLARARARQGRVLVQVRERDAAVGAAVFDARFPRCSRRPGRA